MSFVFDEKAYKSIIEEFGYDTSFIDGFSKPIKNFTKRDLQRIFLCHSGLYNFNSARSSDKLVTSGLGISGIPHIGTLSQIYRLELLSQAGYRAQLVLGDLDAYCGKKTPFGYTQELSDKYMGFIQLSGMLRGDNSIIRKQTGDYSSLFMMYLLARFTEDSDFNDIEENLHEFYVSKNKVDADVTFRRKLSLLLMTADFFSAGQSYANVLVMLGIDEHKYVRFAQKMLDRIDTVTSDIRSPRINSIYTPMIRGLNGYPKMSKSFPESGITLDMSDDIIFNNIMSQEKAQYIQEDVVYQIICAIGLGGITNFETIEDAHKSNRAWNDIKEQLAIRIIGFAKLWRGLE